MRRYFFVIIGLLFVNAVCAQNATGKLIATAVSGKSFGSSDTIAINLQNKTDTKLFIQIALCKKVNQKWMEVLPDIFKTNQEASLENVLYLNSKETRNEYWTAKPFLKNKALKGAYCFKLHIGKNPTELTSQQLTTSFIFK